jgi:taurine dioxygenase
VGDLVIWDNQAVMHQANADYDPEQKRFLYRLMIKGVELTAAQEQHLGLGIAPKKSSD